MQSGASFRSNGSKLNDTTSSCSDGSSTRSCSVVVLEGANVGESGFVASEELELGHRL
jgi:hypothetical protein